MCFKGGQSQLSCFCYGRFLTIVRQSIQKTSAYPLPLPPRQTSRHLNVWRLACSNSCLARVKKVFTCPILYWVLHVENSQLAYKSPSHLMVWTFHYKQQPTKSAYDHFVLDFLNFVDIFFKDEWRRQKAQLIATLERIWAKSVAWTTLATASLDNRQGHLSTELKLNTG